MSVVTADPFERERAKDAALWTGAAILVAALHVGLAVAYLLLKPAPEGQAEAPVIDVAFMPAASAPAPAAPEAPPTAEPTPPVEQSDLAPLPEPEPPPAKAEPAPPEPAPPPVALQAPEPPVEPAQPDQVTVTPTPVKPAEPTPQAKPEKVPERSVQKPSEHEKAEKEKIEREKAEREKAEKAEREKRKLAQQKPAAAPGSRRAQLAMAPNAGVSSEGARAARSSWESEVAARIRQYATYGANGSTQSGTVRVGVTIDRNGRLVSHRLAGSSGSSMLDNAAMAVIARAQPYPRFPPGMNQAQVALIIPLHLRPQ